MWAFNLSAPVNAFSHSVHWNRFAEWKALICFLIIEYSGKSCKTIKNKGTVFNRPWPKQKQNKINRKSIFYSTTWNLILTFWQCGQLYIPVVRSRWTCTCSFKEWMWSNGVPQIGQSYPATALGSFPVPAWTLLWQAKAELLRKRFPHSLQTSGLVSSDPCTAICF